MIPATNKPPTIIGQVASKAALAVPAMPAIGKINNSLYGDDVFNPRCNEKILGDMNKQSPRKISRPNPIGQREFSIPLEMSEIIPSGKMMSHQ